MFRKRVGLLRSFITNFDFSWNFSRSISRFFCENLKIVQITCRSNVLTLKNIRRSLNLLQTASPKVSLTRLNNIRAAARTSFKLLHNRIILSFRVRSENWYRGNSAYIEGSNLQFNNLFWKSMCQACGISCMAWHNEILITLKSDTGNAVILIFCLVVPTSYKSRFILLNCPNFFLFLLATNLVPNTLLSLRIVITSQHYMLSNALTALSLPSSILSLLRP